MSESTLNDVTKMKVVELRKELKSRGLSYAGDKAELVARLQAAMPQEDHTDVTLDSDEIDSDGVLEDEDDKNQTDILDDSAVDTINEELALADHSPIKTAVDIKPQKTLKRKAVIDTSNEKEPKEITAKKIVLNRNTSIPSSATKANEEKTESISVETNSSSTATGNKIKITTDMDPKTRLEMRAKRFGLPIKVTEADRKEARKQRFNQKVASTDFSSSSSLADNLEKLKKRAERFGQSVSSIMTVIENKERLEKRKEKFGTVK